MSVLPPADRIRLVKLLGQLGSDHSGERDAAALAAMKFLRQRKLCWDDVVASHTPVTIPAQRTPLDWRAVAAACLRRPGYLNSWEVGFLRNLSGFSRLSRKQLSTLQGIADRVLPEAAP